MFGQNIAGDIWPDGADGEGTVQDGDGEPATEVGLGREVATEVVGGREVAGENMRLGANGGETVLYVVVELSRRRDGTLGAGFEEDVVPNVGLPPSKNGARCR